MLYTRKESANRLKISLTTLDKLINTGKLTASRIGRQIRISEESINEFLEAHVLRFDAKPKAEINAPIIRQ